MAGLLKKTELGHKTKRKLFVITRNAIPTDCCDEIFFEEGFGKEKIKTKNIHCSQPALDKASAVICADLASLRIASKQKKRFIVGNELHAFNSLSIKLFLSLGAEAVIPSIELSLEEIHMLSPREKIIPLIYFYPLLMTSRAYQQSNLFERNQKFNITDRKDFVYQAEVDNDKILRIYNPLPVDMLFEIEKFDSFGAICIDITQGKSPEAILEYALSRMRGEKPDKKSKFTRGHYEKPLD
jgi:hypothetical protein